MALQAILEKLWLELQGTTMFNPLAFSVLFLSLFFLLKLSRGGKLNLPPSPPKLPIVGNLHQLGTLPHQSFRDLSKKYGPLMLFHMGQTPTLIVSSAAMAREMMTTHDIIFSNRPKTTVADIFLYGCIDIAFAPYGHYWRQFRKIGVLELLTVKRVQASQYVREEEVAIMMEKIRHASLYGGSVNLSEMLLTITNNIVARCVLGRRTEEDGKVNFGVLSRKVTNQLTAFSFGDKFPSLKWMDHLTGLIKGVKETFRELDSFFEEVIEDHRMSEQDDDNYDKKDFVDILLKVQKERMLDVELTQDNLKAILLDMFVGGTDSTSTSMEWTMAELIKHPSMLKKAQEEVRSVVGKKSKIDACDIHKMEYLKCAYKESLRLHPPAALLVHREASASVNMGNYYIPPKTQVLVNAWAIQRDPKFWDKAEEFIPERFYNNPVSYQGQDFQYIPFGAGRRGCPGTLFGTSTAEYVIANLLHWFDWKLPDGSPLDTLDMRETFGLTVFKKIPLHLVPVVYSP